MIKVTDEMVEAARSAYDVHGIRACIEAALAARKHDDAGELVRRLRNNPDTDCDIVADTIEELVEALKPFANDEFKITFMHLRIARAVLKSMGVKL